MSKYKSRSATKSLMPFIGLCLLHRPRYLFRLRYLYGLSSRHLSHTPQLLFKAGMTTETNSTIPNGLSLHVENTTKILLDPQETFLNPVQEFNRDLSVAAITVWSEERNRVKEANWLRLKEKKIHAMAKRKRLRCPFPSSLSL